MTIARSPAPMLAAVTSLLLGVTPRLNAQQQPWNPKDSIERFVTAEMERQRIPGVAVAVIKNGRVVTARGYGQANLEHMVAVTDETVFQSGSLGKMFTSTTVMLLVEQGKLSLSDTITKYFPDAPASWRSITVRHLLTHTSGIPDYTTDGFDYRKAYTEDQLARMAYAMPLEFPPGSRWNYSNTGYALLGFLVRRATGRFYGDVLTEGVFTPLGMLTARVISESAIVPHRAAGYRLVRGQLANQEWVAPELNTTADGSLYWSLRDLIIWNDAVRRRAILKPESWNEILSPVRLNSGKPYPYGFGWTLDQRAGQPLQEHGGGWQGFRTQLSRYIGDSLDIIVLANLAQAAPPRFVEGIAGIMNPRLVVAAPSPIEDREPNVATKLGRILDLLREGRLAPEEFAYVRAGFFPNGARAYETLLKRIGSPARYVLLERREIGDDRVYLYELTFGDRRYRARFGLAPDDRVSSFSLQEVRP